MRRGTQHLRTDTRGESRRSQYALSLRGCGDAFSCWLSLRFRGMVRVGSTIHGQIRSGYVCGFRTGYERNQCGDFVHGAIAVERCVGLLWRRPITRGGIEIGVDRTRLYSVDRNGAATDFPGQSLGEHLDGSLGSRVGSEPRSHHPLADAGADIDDPAAVVHVLQRRLRCDEDGANVEVENVIELLDRRLLKGLGNRRAGVVDQDVERAKRRHGLRNRIFDCFGIGRISLDGDGLSAAAFDGLHHGGSRCGVFGVSDGDTRSIGCQTLCNSSPNTARCPRNQSEFAFKFL